MSGSFVAKSAAPPMAAPPSSSSSRVAAGTVGRAVDALLKWMNSQKKKQRKAQLLEQDDELVYLVLSLNKVPAASRTNPFKIRLPNPVHPTDGSQQTCLIVDDRRRPGKAALTSDFAKKKIESESIPVAKVINLSKLQTDYRPFEAKRKLCGSYDLFFADKRVIPLLPRLLGKQFFKKKKIPIPVDLTKGNWKEQINRACSSGLLYLRTGTCSIIKVGRASQGRDELVQNVITAIEGAAEVVPKKWAGIRSFHLKSLESVALPVYQTVPELGLKIEGYKKVVDGVQMQGGGLEKANSEVGTPKESKEAEKRSRKTSKRGRIHEVHYMDDDVAQLMADTANEVVDDAKDENKSELEDRQNGKETKKKIKLRKEKKAKTVEDGEEGYASKKAKKEDGQSVEGKLKKKKKQT